MKAWLYDWGGLNEALFHAINARHAPWLDALAQALSWAGDHDRFEIYLAALALATGWRYARTPASDATAACLVALMTFCLAYMLDGLLVVGMKAALDLPRPPAALPSGSFVVVGMPELRHGFPSGHAAFAALVAAVLWPLARTRWVRGALILPAIAVCLSRPYLGLHFPADVLYGGLLSVLVAATVRAVLLRSLFATARRRG